MSWTILIQAHDIDHSDAKVVPMSEDFPKTLTLAVFDLCPRKVDIESLVYHIEWTEIVLIQMDSPFLILILLRQRV